MESVPNLPAVHSQTQSHADSHKLPYFYCGCCGEKGIAVSVSELCLEWGRENAEMIWKESEMM